MADGGAHLEGYLGVSRSLSGRQWRERPADSETTRRHQLTHGLSEPLARALASRGVSAEQGGDFLNPTLKALFPDLCPAGSGASVPRIRKPPAGIN